MNNQLSLFDISEEENRIDVSEEENSNLNYINVKSELPIMESINSENRLFELNEIVLIEYKGISYIGVIKSIYNNGETINCSFDEGRKHSAFYIDNVKKI